MFHLVVLEAFSGRKKGELITDAAAVEQILASPHAHHVIKRLSPDVLAVSSVTPSPQPAPEPAEQHEV